MRIELNSAGVEDALDHMRDLIGECGEQYRDLHSHFLKDRDGYPTSGFGSGPPTSELDDDGTPLPPRSDPVARIVIGRDEGEGSTGQALAEFVHTIQSARKLLASAVGQAKRALQPPGKITPEDDIWCDNCKRAGVNSPRAVSAKVCSWCRDNKIGDVYPSPRMVDAHSRGRLTETHRAAIAQREAEERKAEKAKAKRGAA